MVGLVWEVGGAVFMAFHCVRFVSLLGGWNGNAPFRLHAVLKAAPTDAFVQESLVASDSWSPLADCRPSGAPRVPVAVAGATMQVNRREARPSAHQAPCFSRAGENDPVRRYGASLAARNALLLHSREERSTLARSLAVRVVCDTERREAGGSTTGEIPDVQRHSRLFYRLADTVRGSPAAPRACRRTPHVQTMPALGPGAPMTWRCPAHVHSRRRSQRDPLRCRLIHNQRFSRSDGLPGHQR